MCLELVGDARSLEITLEDPISKSDYQKMYVIASYQGSRGNRLDEDLTGDRPRTERQCNAAMESTCLEITLANHCLFVGSRG